MRLQSRHYWLNLLMIQAHGLCLTSFYALEKKEKKKNSRRLSIV